jgi:hypothetical protein
VAHERLVLVVVLALHFGLALWGAVRNSVTFDENFHLPDGVMVIAQRDFEVSPVNPPLVKAACGLAALAAGARLPDPRTLGVAQQWPVGESFMRRNTDHYHRVFLAARLVVILLSLGLALLVWAFARRLYGPRGGLLALAFYAFSAEALAHAGVVTIDVGTGLVMTASMYAFWVFTRTGWWRSWGFLALAVGLAALTRFTSVILGPTFLVLAVAGTALHRFRHPRRVWAGLLLLVPSTLVFLQLGYLGQTSWQPIGRARFESRRLQSLQRIAPGLRLPLPDAYVIGLDIQGREGQGRTLTFLHGRELSGRVWTYFPIALLAKWPLGFLLAVPARAWQMVRRRRRRWHEGFVLVPALVVLLSTIVVLQLNIGIRYLFPMIPRLSIWLGGFVADTPRVARSLRAWARLGTALALIQALEVMAAAPWYLAFYNRMFGGVGGGYWLVNDSNVDWGQGLIALRDELRRRGIGKIHLAYHGTTDPGVYGIDYVPYLGGTPGPESDWLAVSSYYFVGLAQRMTTMRGRSSLALQFDFHGLSKSQAVATPAGCIYLFRLR